MRTLSIAARLAAAGVVAAVVIGSETPTAQARDFFSAFFGALTGRPSPPPQLPGFGDTPPPQADNPSAGGRSMAYCVRTCDGRHFPINASNEQSRAAACSSLCPASETKIY